MTTKQRRRLEALVRQQVQIEAAARKALNELEESKEKPFRDLLKHPLLLLAAGSILTGILGSFFAAQWQLNEWKIQQEHQIEVEEAKEMRELQIETAEQFAETFGVAQDVLHLFEWEWAPESKIVSLGDRGQRWTRSSRQWRVAENVLLARVRSKFGPEVGKAFTDIADKRRRVGNSIMLLLVAADTAKTDANPDFDGDKDEARKIVSEVMKDDGSLAKLMALMEKRIADVEKKRRKSKPNIEFLPAEWIGG